MLENRGVVWAVGNTELPKCCGRDPYFLGKLSSKQKNLGQLLLGIDYQELKYSC